MSEPSPAKRQRGIRHPKTECNSCQFATVNPEDVHDPCFVCVHPYYQVGYRVLPDKTCDLWESCGRRAEATCNDVQ